MSEDKLVILKKNLEDAPLDPKEKEVEAEEKY